MSDSLDDKLREILNNARFDEIKSLDYTQHDIAQIKQAFADKGYVLIPQVELTDYSHGRPTDVFTVNGKEVMSGQDWCNRFEKEMYTLKKQEYKLGTFADDEEKVRFYRDGGTNFMYRQALEAAKRAAGIDDSNVIN